ncbi:DUF1761 domain-containing protein [Novosphingobium sp. PASSN1]|uniref:DUF1761 domain-containing protein n=1 Tax=Novosphingobium sp. PASSN1 TaxID=2015561 RepID=UPI000BD52AD9|nr:DUF1761 domain-containing protein [Novosphingobium sp. PASSN1]OYU33070.1 MAG: hypothetical protein CFE35_22190 [Novosphingobium sp. PASSN1]
MGPVNWLAVVAAALAALAFGAGVQGAAARTARQLVLAGALLLLTSAMMGHMFARVGAATLAVKPWLYFMMSGGLALAFVAPALAMGEARGGASAVKVLRGAAFWIVSYLVMGTVFWLFKA